MCRWHAREVSPTRSAPAIAIAFAAALLATAIPARGSVILVPGDYPTIQAAISAAATGDEVRVAAGTYTGNANKNLDLLGKDIAVIGEGPGQTIIDCQSNGLPR